MRNISRAALAAVFAAGLGAASALAQQAPPPPAPKDFAKMAAQSDQFEILSGQVAMVQSRNPQVQAFAQQMIADHRRTSEALKAAAMQSRLEPPPEGIDADQARLLMSLQSASGAEFDKLYATQQTVAHQAALVLQQGYAMRGSDPNLRQAATSATPVIQHHLQMAQQMRAAAGG